MRKTTIRGNSKPKSNRYSLPSTTSKPPMPPVKPPKGKGKESGNVG